MRPSLRLVQPAAASCLMDLSIRKPVLGLFAFFRKRQPLRAIVATRSESLAAAVRKINLHNRLAVENAVLPPRELLPRPAYFERMRGR